MYKITFVAAIVIICVNSTLASLPGSGTQQDPWRIESLADFSEFAADANYWDDYTRLETDVNLAGRTYSTAVIAPDADNSNWVFDGNAFTGVFDGNDHKIINLTINGGANDYYLGLFGYIGDGQVRNLGLGGGSVSGDRFVGGLVGENYHGSVSNCYSTTSVTGMGHNVGGLVGENDGGSVSNCYSTGSVSGGVFVGGLVGENFRGSVSNCYSTGSVSGIYHVGGLVGWNVLGSIWNCYSTGFVTGFVNGYKYIGGLVGLNLGTVSSSFWDIETSEQTTSASGTGKTTAEMQTESTFTGAGWDFTTPVWTIDEGVDYPRLWWELAPVLHAEPEVTLGTSNIITWDPVPGANDYYAECAEDANFTSIVYSTGWITETNCEFIGLQLGQQYWYSVKARNTAGTETGWSNVEFSLQGTLTDAVDMMLDPDTLKNKNMKNALLNKINAVQQMLDAGRYEEALNKLQNDLLQKTNGCALTGEPDRNDWIITCEGQSVLYPLVIETMENVRELMGE